jgi:hypothetical protein
MSSTIGAGGDPGKSTVVEFPVSDEERARRLKVEVERLGRLPPAEWIYYVESAGYAEKYGVDKTTLKTMVEATIKENEKKAREDRGELRRREDRAEKQRSKEKSDAKKEAERKDREARKEAERSEQLLEARHLYSACGCSRGLSPF